MADITDIRFALSTEEQAAAAEEIAKMLIKISYAKDEKEPPAWAADAGRCASLAEAYFRYGDRTESYDPTMNCSYCAILRVHREGKMLLIDRCGDIVRGFIFSGKNEFFPQLCAAIALRFPGLPFTADCRYEMTVSDVITYDNVTYDGERFVDETRYEEEDEPKGPWRDVYVLEPNGLLQRIP